MKIKYLFQWNDRGDPDMYDDGKRYEVPYLFNLHSDYGMYFTVKGNKSGNEHYTDSIFLGKWTTGHIKITYED